MLTYAQIFFTALLWRAQLPDWRLWQLSLILAPPQLATVAPRAQAGAVGRPPAAPPLPRRVDDVGDHRRRPRPLRRLDARRRRRAGPRGDASVGIARAADGGHCESGSRVRHVLAVPQRGDAAAAPACVHRAPLPARSPRSAASSMWATGALHDGIGAKVARTRRRRIVWRTTVGVSCCSARRGAVWTAVTCVCGVRLGIDTPTVVSEVFTYVHTSLGARRHAFSVMADRRPRDWHRRRRLRRTQCGPWSRRGTICERRKSVTSREVQ